MSERHWIDAFFRKRLGQRDLPVEEGEFEDIRAMLEQRNAATAGAARGFSKWWLSVVIPVAGLLWWANDRSAAGTDEHVHSTIEANVVVANGDEHGAHAAASEIMLLEAHPSSTTEQNGSARAASPQEQAVRVKELIAHDPAVRTRRSTQPMATEGARPHDVMAAQDPIGLNAPDGYADVASRSDRDGTGVHGIDAVARVGDEVGEPQPVPGTLRSDRNGTPLDQVAAKARVDEGEDGALRMRAVPLQDGEGLLSYEVDRSATRVMENPELLSASSDADAVTFMQLRWSTPPMAGTPVLTRRDVEAIKDHPMGELHLFGAPLAVRTRARSGDRSDAEMGSLVGLEYRVRAKHFAWATGIHYGSYTLRADQGTANVSLNFVEVPLLASKQIGMGRFKLMMQGGLSVDFLFNAKGQYPLDVPRAVAGFPDDAFHTINCSWLLRPQAIYVLGEHLSVSTGPLWKGQLGAVATKGALDGTRFSASGLSFGVTWRLDRSTF